YFQEALAPEGLLEHSRRNEAPQEAERPGCADRITELRRSRHDGRRDSVRHAFRRVPLPRIVRKLAQYTIAYLCVVGQSLRCLALFVDEIRRGETGLDQNASNAKFAHLVIERLGVAFEGVLGRAIDTHEGCGKKSKHRADENDAAAS